MRFIAFIIFLLSFSQFTIAQTESLNILDSSITITSILVSGNKHTKTNIVLRELMFKEGDVIKLSKFQEAIEISKSQIFNTTLFSDIKIQATPAPNTKNGIVVFIILKERWYIFPLPTFKLVDRNFNEWWITHNKSLERVDYGIKFYHNNLTGNNDRLSLEAITGYNRQFGLRYNLPYFDKKLTKGINIGFVYNKQKELNYSTSSNNKQQFLTALNGFPKSLTRIDATFTNRVGLFTRHSFRVAYTWDKIDTFVALANPKYFGNAQTQLNYFDVSYGLNYSKTDYNIYPTKGLSYNVSAYARVFAGENNYLNINGNAMLATSFTDKLFMRNRVAATLKAPFNTAFINEQVFGYGVYQLRGMEYYVVDGVAALMHKFTLAYNIKNFKIKTPIKNKYLDEVPFKVYARVYNDIGFCFKENSNTFLNNRILHGFGIGADIVTIYDMVFKLEYSLNGFGNAGFFFGMRD